MGLMVMNSKSNSVDEIKTVMKKIIQQPDENLLKMGERSSELANKIDQKLWAKTVVEF